MNIKKEIIQALKEIDLFKNEDIESSLEIPPQHEFGDIASNICFSLSKKLKKQPQKIAEEFVQKISLPKNSMIEKIEARAGYINFFYNYKKLSDKILKKILKENGNYGSSDLGNGKKYMIEFAHPNTHKVIHIGHLRTMCLGESLSRILEFSGYRIIRTNYQGDIGPHVSKCIWGFIHLYHCKPPKTNRGRWLGRVYIEANKKYSESEEIRKQVREITVKLYQGDEELTKIWKMTREWSLKDFDEIYQELGIKFDRLYFESEVAERGKQIVLENMKRKIFKKSEGAVVLDLSKYGMGTRVFITKEGYPTYEAKDLGLAEFQFKEFEPDKCIHVVAVPQKDYFQFIFKTFELIKSPAAHKSYHLSYELVALKEGKIASRLGRIVSYYDLRDELIKKVLKEVEKRNPNLSENKKMEISKQIAFGALKYTILSTGPEKRIIFDWKEALSLEGNTGPYLQYAYVRANKILGKAEKWGLNFKFKSKKLEEWEKKLIKKLLEFPETVEKASIDLKPHYICNYAYELATVFNEFYHTCPVLKAKPDNRDFRLTLVKATQITLKNALKLLGIETPEKM